MKAPYTFLLLAIMVLSCTKTVDLEQDRALLLAANESQRKAHMENNPDLLLAGMADTVITVQRGQFRVEAKADMYGRWQDYFASVKYYAWDDLEPPVVEISKDGSLASVSVRKITIGSYEQEPIDTTYFAWTTGYKKVDGAWKVYKVTSTRTE